MNNTFDVIVVGSGFAGSVCANILSEKGKNVLLLEERKSVGGNMHEDKDENGLVFHEYGPHIFHTNSDIVYKYISKFSEWFFYEHYVLGCIDKTLVPIPFNYKSIELLFNKEKSEKIIKSLKKNFKNIDKVSILDLINHGDVEIKELGNFVYEKVFANYTSKQWGISIEDIDTSVINRVPVILGYDNRYFQDKYQFMPKNGYNELFSNLLKNEKIKIRLNTKAEKVIKIVKDKIYFEDQLFSGKLIYTGQIDELFGYKLGKLPYRSIDFKFETHNMNYFQPCPVVNYPNDFDYTRITEFKYLSNQQSDKTITLKEYPTKHTGANIPYYPIANKKSDDLYKKYLSESKKVKNLIMCGRLAEYKYYNMDQVILRAIEIAKEIK